jgi:hypothetical protein
MYFIFTLLKSFIDIHKLKKSLLLILSFVLYFILYIYEKNKKNRFISKILNLLPFQRLIVDNYLSNISSKYKNEKEKETLKLISLLSLANFSEIDNTTLKSELKQKLLKELQEKKHSKNISGIKSVYVDKSFRFGNSMAILNNLLYYCEILNITQIYLNSQQNWPISQNVTTNFINITLIPKIKVNLKERSVGIFDKNFIYFQRVFKPEIRIDSLKNEIKRNLPKINLNPNDLFIHIRSGDIFNYKYNKDSNYAQPPLCFYQSIINKFNFTKIFIIAENKKNPIIDILIKQYPKILFTNNELEKDVAILANAYYLVGSISSFFTTLIIINENLKAIWEYAHYMLIEKYLHLHHDIYNYRIKYSIYKMYPSLKFKSIMFPWRSSKEQINFMINEKCEYFQLIRPHEKNNLS